MVINAKTVSSSSTRQDMNNFVPPNSPHHEAYQHHQYVDHSLESPSNAAMIEARMKDLENQQQHRVAHHCMEQPYAYQIQDIPETPRTHNQRGGTRTPLRLAAQQQTANSTIISPSPEDIEMAWARAQESATQQHRGAPMRSMHPVAPPSTDIQVSWARAQAQEPWYQDMPLGSPPVTGSHMGPAQTGSESDHDSYSTRPLDAYNAPPPSAIPIPYEWCSPAAAALPPPPGFENTQIGSSASSSPRQSLRAYRSRADSEGSHYDSALSSHSPCSVHRDDGSLRLSISDGDVDPSLGPSSPAFSTTSSLYTAASCMYCLPSDDNGYTNHLAATASPGFVVPAAPQADCDYDEDGYLLRPKEPSSPGFSYPTSRSASNSSYQGLFCSSDNDGSIVEPEPVHGSIVVPHHGPGPIGRPRSVEDQTSNFLKRRQERIAKTYGDCLEEENIESMKFLVEAELLI